MGWACNEKENAVIDSLKKVYQWRSTRWWYALHARMMKENPENRTRWRHKWGWHNRGNVWDMMATRWAGEKDWMIKRKEHTSPNAKHKFITYILNKMKLSTAHMKIEKKDGDKKLKKKTPRYLGLGDNTFQTREEGPTVQLRGDSNVACKWINGEYAQGTKYKDITGKIQKFLHSCGREVQPHRSLTSTTS